MDPLRDGCFAPRNRWYVAGLSREIERDPIERWILNEPVAFYRTEAGEAVALAGRCPHRGYPLGKSKVQDDAIVCGYHGLRFERDGRCSSIPSQALVPPKCAVHAYPVVEHWEWLWIWPGDPALADPSLIPDHRTLGLTDPAWIKRPPLYWRVDGRHQLLHDNLLDLSHLTVLHADTIGGGDVAGTEERHEEGEGWVRSLRHIPDATVTAWVRKSRGITGAVDREIMLTFVAPRLHFGHDRYYRAAPPGAEREVVLEVRVFHAVTPATLTTCHYFVTSAVDPATFELSRANPPDPEAALKIFREDVEAINEIERLLQTAGPFDEIPLRADVHALKGRRMMEQMVLAEGALPSAQRMAPEAVAG